MKIANHRRIGVSPENGAKQVVRIADVGDPVAHGFVDGVFQRFAAGFHADYFGAKHFHARDVERLTGHVLGAHVHGALQSEMRRDRGRRYAMLACTRIGAIHSVVFGGFSPDSLANRIVDCESNVVITADEGLRGGKPVPLKANTDEALKKAPGVKKVLVVRHTGGKIAWDANRDVWWHEIAAKVKPDCPPEPMGAEDPLFILYTSGSTGKPKGIQHSTGGYLLGVSMTHKLRAQFAPTAASGAGN